MTKYIIQIIYKLNIERYMTGLTSLRVINNKTIYFQIYKSNSKEFISYKNYKL